MQIKCIELFAYYLLSDVGREFFIFQKSSSFLKLIAYPFILAEKAKGIEKMNKETLKRYSKTQR